MNGSRSNWQRRWLMPMLLLSLAALGVFAAVYLLDHWVTGHISATPPANALERYLALEPDKLTDAISSLSGIIAAVLGIVITVVSIIVQLSADRYTGVAQMFLRDRINVAVMGYYVVACVCGVWLSMGLHEDFVPRAALLLTMLATSFGLVLMLPYFAYVFWFLEPANIVARLGRGAMRTVAGAARATTPERISELQVAVLTAMAELTDITSNSISGKDKIVASSAVDAFKDFVREYLAIKDRAPAAWFRIGQGIRSNPDFVAMDPESLHDLEERRTWVEWQVLRQYLGIYNEVLTTMQDINYLIAIDTRYIGEAAGERRDVELIALVFRYMNSYLRATLNARNVRTAYNVLNQYRLLIHTLLRQGNGKFALEGTAHMNYYGHVSYDMTLTFVTETVAYDVAALCQAAHELKSPEHRAMLGLFLDLDRPLRLKSQERALLGVRKAQVKLAAYYLTTDAKNLAQLIADDMKDEPAERLNTIREELARVESKDFWEIIDRGRNFEFMPPQQRFAMQDYFVLLAEKRSAD